MMAQVHGRLIFGQILERIMNMGIQAGAVSRDAVFNRLMVAR